MSKLSDYKLDFFRKSLEKLEIEISENQIEQFVVYYEELIKWNEFMNLTTITEFEDVFIKHFIDSLLVAKVIEFNKIDSIIDIGTGAGFPGIPLKIVYPHLNVTLLDSLNKRIQFLNHIKESLQLENLELLHGRAEDYGKQIAHREKYDLSVSRAVSNLSALSEYCLPFVKVGGNFISYKSDKINEELELAKQGIVTLGGNIVDIKEELLPFRDICRFFAVIQKVDLTPEKYPRKAGLPTKKPL